MSNLHTMHTNRWSDLEVMLIIGGSIATTRVYVGHDSLVEGIAGCLGLSVMYWLLLVLRDYIARRFFGRSSEESGHG